MTLEELRKKVRERKAKQQKNNALELCTFSKKQRMALAWWKMPEYLSANGIIADGAVRSGKTVALSLGFILWAMKNYDGQFFAICGRTIGSVRRNILGWLLPMLPSLSIRSVYHRAENRLELSCAGKTNTFYIFGAKDERAQDAIQGLTLAGVFFDEAAIMPESFVSQATARCSVSGSKFWFSCNPLGPRHWFKTSWIDKAEERNILYLHFTMQDNLSLSDEVRQRYQTMYSGVFYRRYVLGEWCVAEGLVYPMFSAERNIRKEPLEEAREFLSCDYGTNNPFALGLMQTKKNESGFLMHLRAEYYHDGRKKGQLTDSEYADAVEEFIQKNEASPEMLIVDPSAASFIAEMRKRGYRVVKARNAVLQGIHAVSEALSAETLTVSPDCVNTIREFGEYVWDEGASEHGEDKPSKQHDHAMDMLRYALMTWQRIGSERASHSGRVAI